MPWDVSTHGGNIDLLRELRRREVSFLIVGGAAVAVHGCRDGTHFDEIDILADPTIANAERIIAALTAVGIGIPFSPDDLAKPRKRVPVHTPAYDVDVLTPRPGEDFAGLLGRSVPAVLNNLAVRVIGRSDLIAMKQVAVQESEDPAKHQRDLDCLRGGSCGLCEL
jgi:hypothetical protein